MGHQEDAIKLFLTEDVNEANKIVKKLNTYNSQRQEKEKEIFNDAINKLKDEDLSSLNSIVLSRR